MTNRSPATPGSALPQPDPHQAQMLLLSRLWSEAQPVVAAMVAGAVVDFQHSEDLVSQVAETVVMKFDDYDRSRPFTPWALGITRNIILRHYERRAGERLVFFDDRILSAMAIALGRDPRSQGCWRSQYDRHAAPARHRLVHAQPPGEINTPGVRAGSRRLRSGLGCGRDTSPRREPGDRQFTRGSSQAVRTRAGRPWSAACSSR